MKHFVKKTIEVLQKCTFWVYDVIILVRFPFLYYQARNMLDNSGENNKVFRLCIYYQKLSCPANSQCELVHAYN